MALVYGTKFLNRRTYTEHAAMKRMPEGTGDPILSDGTLLVLDMGWDPDKTSTLADGLKLTNLADLQCSALTGGTEDDRKCVLTSNSFVPKTTPGTGDGVIEHTGKGAVHVALRQAAPAVDGHGWRIVLGEEIRQYVKDLPNHDYLFGLWSLTTRSPGSGTRFGLRHGTTGGVNSNYLVSLLYDQLRTQAPGNHAAAIASPANETSVGVKRHVMRGQGWTGIPPNGANMNAFDSEIRFGFGSTLATQGSWAVYRLWMEDLTVSGRTPTEVAEIDKAMYDKAFATGGRFAGDTYTDPATL